MYPDLEGIVDVDSTSDTSGPSLGIEYVSRHRLYALTELRVVLARNVLDIIETPSIGLDISSREKRHTVVDVRW